MYRNTFPITPRFLGSSDRPMSPSAIFSQNTFQNGAVLVSLGCGLFLYAWVPRHDPSAGSRLSLVSLPRALLSVQLFSKFWGASCTSVTNSTATDRYVL